MQGTRARAGCVALGAALTLGVSGCDTIAAGIAVHPAGVNSHSFRECLIANGFFTDHALLGRSARGHAERHAAEPPPPAPADIATMNDAAFAVRSAQIIRAGLFPYLQYDDATARLDPLFDAGVAEPAYNRPYMAVREGVAAGAPGASLRPPPAGDPPRPEIAINRYLDCYIGPVGVDEEGLSSTGDSDVEGRLLRAHVTLTMLAAFGAELVVSKTGRHQPEQAARLLGHVRDAELSLRAASPLMNADLRRLAVASGWINIAATPAPRPARKRQPFSPAAAAKARLAAIDAATALDEPHDVGGATPLLRWHPYATRLLRVFQIGVDVEAIDAQQSLNRLTNIIAAFSTPTPGAFQGILTDALKGLATVQKVQLYGEAMGRDARETLAAHRLMLREGVPIARVGRILRTWRYDVPAAALRWQIWDVRLDETCQLLATVAKQASAGCVPNAESLKDALAAELPARPAPAP